MIEDPEDFFNRWRQMLTQMVQTACDVMEDEMKGGDTVRGLLVMPLDEQQWAEYKAEKMNPEPTDSGMLS